VLYVLDEPSIGLHQRDNERLLDTLRRLRDLGNTVIVVEHDEDAIRAADHVVDIGPGAGVHGGAVVARGHAATSCMAQPEVAHRPVPVGRAQQIADARRSGAGPTRRTLHPRRRRARQQPAGTSTVQIPLGVFTCVTGVSGGGKSTLVIDTLYKALARQLNGAREQPGAARRGSRASSTSTRSSTSTSRPIGRTPRSNPATYTGAFTPIRELVRRPAGGQARAATQPGRFSLQRQGRPLRGLPGRRRHQDRDALPAGRVRAPAMSARASATTARRWRSQFKGKSIADVLDMTVEEAARVLRARCQRIARQDGDAGATWASATSRLGQQATTLSGGEAQRVKLAKELSQRATGRTLYILDEPTTGLHFHDVADAARGAARAGRRRATRVRGDRAQPRRHQDGRLDRRHGPGWRRWRR